METPTTAQRALTERTPIRLSAVGFIGLISASITLTAAAAAWATTMATSQSNLERWARTFDRRLDRLENAIGVKHPNHSDLDDAPTTP